ncbi:MAG: hypothetical protein ACTS6A_02640 [Candidatus Hodgkinia cicadicola]
MIGSARTAVLCNETTVRYVSTFTLTANESASAGTAEDASRQVCANDFRSFRINLTTDELSLFALGLPRGTSSAEMHSKALSYPNVGNVLRSGRRGMIIAEKGKTLTADNCTSELTFEVPLRKCKQFSA